MAGRNVKILIAGGVKVDGQWRKLYLPAERQIEREQELKQLEAAKSLLDHLLEIFYDKH